jgi:transposase-like protein
MENKSCSKCGISKLNTLEYFIKGSDGKPDGKCKECKKTYNKEYSIKTKKQRLEYIKKWQEENKEKDFG